MGVNAKCSNGEVYTILLFLILVCELDEMANDISVHKINNRFIKVILGIASKLLIQKREFLSS